MVQTKNENIQEKTQCIKALSNNPQQPAYTYICTVLIVQIFVVADPLVLERTCCSLALALDASLAASWPAVEDDTARVIVAVVVVVVVLLLFLLDITEPEGRCLSLALTLASVLG